MTFFGLLTPLLIKMPDEVRILRDEVSRLRDEMDEIALAKRQVAAFARGASASRPATLAELVERRDALRAIKEANMSCAMVRSAGYSTRGLSRSRSV